MAKNILFCADGTWNSPGQDENHDGVPDKTNVYKLFLALKGNFCSDSLLNAGEQEKTLAENGAIRQVAKYIHGVGDSRNPIVKILGGATGAGTISRIVRGYTYISRSYTEGDKILIVGFSRGAYTARALAGMIVSQGLLRGVNYASQKSREDAYKRASQVWYRYRKTHGGDSYLAKLTEALAYLPGFVSRDTVTQQDLLPVQNIEAIAVWDTVGAMGIPNMIGDGEKYDAFRFADTCLSKKVSMGFHAISLDEKRAAFLPTLWDQADNVVQVLFAGAHADVGGGYPENGLSDFALGWVIEKLTGRGVEFNSFTTQQRADETAHKPWLSPLFKDPNKQQTRSFQNASATEHPSIQQRCDLPSVRADPSESPAKYAPSNRPKRSNP